MAVTETLRKLTSNVELDNGSTASGNTRTVSVSLGTLDINKWDAQKAMNITDALSACLTKAVLSLYKTGKYRIEED